MSAEQFANLSQSTLNGAITNVATTALMTSAATFPLVPQFRIRIDHATIAGIYEFCLVTAVSTNTFTITRGIEGTAGTAFPTGSTVTHVWTAAALSSAYLRADQANTTATFTEVTAADYKATGVASLTNARNTRYVGAWTTVGAPAGLTGAVGDWGFDKNDRKWVCITAGSPGTWIDPIAYYSSDYNLGTAPAITAATYTLIKFATSQHGGDPSSSYSGTTGLYTAKIAGNFYVSTYMAVASSGGTIGGYIAKNAGVYQYLSFVTGSRISGSYSMPLAVGDTVSAYCWCTGTTTMDNTLVPVLQVQYLG